MCIQTKSKQEALLEKYAALNPHLELQSNSISNALDEEDTSEQFLGLLQISKSMEPVQNRLENITISLNENNRLKFHLEHAKYVILKPAKFTNRTTLLTTTGGHKLRQTIKGARLLKAEEEHYRNGTLIAAPIVDLDGDPVEFPRKLKRRYNIH